MRRPGPWLAAALAWALVALVPGTALAEVVRHVIDGDTLVLTDGRKVRLIGVDSPEIHDDSGRNERSARRTGANPKKVREQAKKAKRFLKKETEGRRVRLVPDPAASPTGLDDYGRTLAYVYREDDGYFVNAQIISEGHGFAFTKYPIRHAEDFKRRETRAREQRKGLWG